MIAEKRTALVLEARIRSLKGYMACISPKLARYGELQKEYLEALQELKVLNAQGWGSDTLEKKRSKYRPRVHRFRDSVRYL